MRGPIVGLLVLVAACGGRASAPNGPRPVPNPGPELGPEPSPPAELLGRDWLDQVLPHFRERWTQSFLESARTLLAPEHPLNDRKLEVTLGFRVDAEGNVVEPQVAVASGNLEFDGAALEVVTESSPLPPPPETLRSDDGFVHVRWRFARDERREGLTGVTVDRQEYELAKAIPELLARRRFAEAARRLAREPVPAQVHAVAGHVLLDAIADGDGRPETRDAAARAVIELGWPDGVRWLTANQSALPLEVQARLTPAVPPLEAAEVTRLVGVLGDRAGARAARAAAARALGKADTPEVRKALVGALADREGAVRAAAADALAELRPGAKIFYGALPLLLDRDPEVRRAAMLLVARADGKRAMSELPLRCRREKDRGVLLGCAQALGELTDDGARLELVRQTRSSDVELARAAWRALAARRDPAARALLTAQAGHADPVVRGLAMSATQDPAALVAGLGDADRAVRWAALRALLRRDRAEGVTRALALLAAAEVAEERWWVAAALLEAE